MRKSFIDKKFQARALATIEKANEIIDDYLRQGFKLTLRQLYYQFVARALIENSLKSYKALGDTISDGRLAGLIDWDAIEDRTREVNKPSAWTSPADILDAIADQYRENPWLAQDYRPEVWIEKEALIGVIEPICERLRVPSFACRGYVSQSAAYEAGKQFEDAIRDGKTPIVFHLGDHDPSGIDMTRDNGDRLAMFAYAGVEVKRLALNMDQVREYNPPENPAKATDARFAGYLSEFGESCWELDALDPATITALIRDAIDPLIDGREWKASMDQETERRALLRDLSGRWEDVATFLAKP